MTKNRTDVMGLVRMIAACRNWPPPCRYCAPAIQRIEAEVERLEVVISEMREAVEPNVKVWADKLDGLIP